MKKSIPYARQNIEDDDIQAVIDILKSDWLTQGPVLLNFEDAFCQYTNAKYSMAVNSATAALHLACLALELGPGDRLWTSPNTFVASSNCALYCGAEVDFVDIDEKTYNFSAEAFEEKLRKSARINQLPKVIVPVHFAGQSCDMKRIKALADQYEIKIIEDASHAVGGRYLNEPIGSCAYSDITVFSFHPVKIMTTGEGGMALTNNVKLMERMKLLRSHGVTRDEKWMTHESEGAWYYQQLDLGFNYRMCDIQAGLGISQLKKVDHFVSKRNVIAKQYDEALKALPITLPPQSPDAYNAFHLYPILLNSNDPLLDRKSVFNQLREAGIAVNVHYIPVHTQPFYQKMGFKLGDFPVAERYYAHEISLPIFYDLSQEDQVYVIETLYKIIGMQRS